MLQFSCRCCGVSFYLNILQRSFQIVATFSAVPWGDWKRGTFLHFLGSFFSVNSSLTLIQTELLHNGPYIKFCFTHNLLTPIILYGSLVGQSSRQSHRLQPGDLTKNALNATSLSGLSGESKHVLLGFLPPASSTKWKRHNLVWQGSHSSESGGFIWRKEASASAIRALQFMFYDDFVEIVSPPPQKTQSFVFVSMWVWEGHSVLGN